MQTGRGNTEQFVKLMTASQVRTGIAAGVSAPGPKAVPAEQGAVSIRCFGQFQMKIGGRPVVMGGMKPRTRALLRRLCADAGAPLHREVLQKSLWPNTDPEAASHNLHVAISNLRHALEPGVGRGASSMIVREGDAYRLALPAGADVDVQAFEHSLERSRAARLSGDLQNAVVAFEKATAVGRKELLPEDGSAEWVVERRGSSQAAIAETARPLAERLLAAGQAETSARVAAAGLDADRFDDGLWRSLIAAREKAGDEAGLRRAQSDYLTMLRELEPATGS